MRSSILIPVLLGAGAIAHPHFKLNNPLAHVHHRRQQPAKVVTSTIGGEVVVEDIFVDYVNAPVAAAPAPTTTSAAVVAAPEKLEVAPVQQQQHNKQPAQQQQNVVTTTAVPVPTTSATPAPVTTSAAPVQSSAPSTSSNDGAPQSGGKSILESANTFRSLMGLPSFTYDSTLGGNAAKTNNDDGANAMTHELNPGSFAQCIAQVDNNSGAGGFTPFELTYLGWLCEIPDGRLGNDCAVMKQATNMLVDTSDPGHANILRNVVGTYTKMGCNYMTSTQSHANFAGMWTCDFA